LGWGPDVCFKIWFLKVWLMSWGLEVESYFLDRKNKKTSFFDVKI
jgi:hypothetical protein